MSASTREQAASSGEKKAAIFLLSLSYEDSAALLKTFSDEEVERVARAMTELEEIDEGHTTAVLREFWKLSGQDGGALRGGPLRTRRLLTTAFGADGSKQILERTEKNRGQIGDLAALQGAEPEQLARFFADESPQTVALVLSQLQPDVAGEVLGLLAPEVRVDVFVRMAELDETTPDVVNELASHLVQRLRSLGAVQRKKAGGLRTAADVLTKLDRDLSDQILDHLDGGQPELAAEIRDAMFAFDDLLEVDANGIKELAARVDRKILTMALKGTSDDLQDLFLQTMSTRGREMMREDMEALGPVRIRDVEAAQKEIIQLAISLEKEGTLSLTKSESDQYVV